MGSKYFVALNLVSEYWQIPPDADAQEKFSLPIQRFGSGRYPFWTYLGTSHFPETDGDSVTRASLDDTPVVLR